MDPSETRAHFRHSSLREKIVEHLFLGELLKALWRGGAYDVEIARPEIDNAGTDLIVGRGDVVRHVQLKASFLGAKTGRQTLNVALGGKPSGCVIWIVFNPETLDPIYYLWFGGAPGAALSGFENFPKAKHTRGDSQGKKAERPNMRLVNKKQFQRLDSIEAVIEALFGP